MLSYCKKIYKNHKNSNNKTILLWICATCGCKKSRFVKKQEANRLLNSLGLETPLSKILLLGDILFWMQFHWIILNDLIVLIRILPHYHDF